MLAGHTFRVVKCTITKSHSFFRNFKISLIHILKSKNKLGKFIPNFTYKHVITSKNHPFQANVSVNFNCCIILRTTEMKCNIGM